MVNLTNFLEVVEVKFPKTLQLNSNLDSNHGSQFLERQLMVMDQDGVDFDSHPSYLSFNNDTDACRKVLGQLLDVLDANLGDIYLLKSSKIYGNRLPWKENKIPEMESPGLVYVVYRSSKDQSVMLFMSFMLTEEPSFESPDGITNYVIYLYEIQLTENVRNQGFGFKLINDYLRGVATTVAESQNETKTDKFLGILLTVFSDNNKAVSFYKDKLNMELAPFSPTDELVGRRVTRNSQNKKSHTVRKPAYYNYFLPIL